MTDSKIERQRLAVLRAQERLGRSMADEEEKERKRRNGRNLKLGVLAEQMFLAGDLVLLERFEAAAREQFSKRAADKTSFEFDQDKDWFEKTRDKARAARASRAEGSSASPSLPRPSSQPSPAAKPASIDAARAKPTAGSKPPGISTPTNGSATA